MKFGIVLLGLVIGTVSFADEPPGYDEEMLHNSVHAFVEAMETPRVFTFAPEDTTKFRETYQALSKAVDNVHDQLEEHAGYPAIRKAVVDLEIPAQAFYRAARENQIRAGNKRNLHTNDVFTFMALQDELEFWTTPINP